MYVVYKNAESISKTMVD